MKLALIASLLLSAAPVAAKTYDIDAGHSSVSFKIRHLVGKVRGNFEKFSGTVDYEPGNPKTWKAQAEIDAASINTSVANRDKHLRDADFFDVTNCPKIIFKSTKVEPVGADAAKLHGDLTMHCVTKPIVLDLKINGEAKDPWGNTKLGATATGKLNRKDWGLTWNKAVESGGVLVGEEVELELEIEAAPQQAKK